MAATKASTMPAGIEAVVDPQQQLATSDRTERILCIAGAGGGKTTVLVRRVAHMVKRGIPPRSILLVTFTRKAAAEMKGRLANLVDPFAWAEITVGTIHSVALGILRQYGSHLGYMPDRPGCRITIADDETRDEFIKMALDICPRKPGIRALMQVLEKYNSTAVADVPDDSRWPITYAWWTYRKLLIESNVVDFGGVLAGAIQIMAENPEVRDKCHSRWRHMLIDEAHDSNRAQWKVIEMLSPRTLFAIYDPRQTIYGWNGAEPGLVRDVVLEGKSLLQGAESVEEDDPATCDG